MASAAPARAASFCSSGKGDSYDEELGPNDCILARFVSTPEPSTAVGRLAERNGRAVASQGVAESSPSPQVDPSPPGAASARSPKKIGAQFGATCLTREQGANARFLGHVFTRLRASGASIGRLPFVWRPVPHPRCRYGQNLAPPSEFADQRVRAQTVVDWDGECVSLLRRLESGRQPLILDLFCAAGAVTEGCRRIGITAVGRDIEPQPRYVARFGEEYFDLGDGLNRERLRALIRRFQPIGIWASPAGIAA